LDAKDLNHGYDFFENINEIDIYSVSQINAKAVYLSYSNTLAQLAEEALEISTTINTNKYEINVLNGKLIKDEIEYKKQGLNDVYNLIQIFGPSLSEAAKQSDLMTIAVTLILYSDKQALAESVSDYINSPRITRLDLKKNRKEINSMIKKLETENKTLEYELKQNKKMQEEAKAKMKEAMEVFYENNK